MWKVLYEPNMPDSTDLLNEHFSAVLPEGIYAGFDVLADNASTVLTVVPGRVMTSNGRVFTSDTATLLPALATGHPSYDRIDAIVINGTYANPPAPTIAVLQGAPAASPSAPVVSGQSILLALVRVRANTVVINQFDIEMAERPALNADAAGIPEAILSATSGNRRLTGLTLTKDGCAANQVKLRAGSCLIGGRYQSLMNDYTFSFPTAPTALFSKTSPDPTTVLNALRPIVPTRLEISVGVTDIEMIGTVIVIGRRQDGTGVSDTLAPTTARITTVDRATYETVNVYAQVDSITLSNFGTGGSNITDFAITAKNIMHIFIKKHGQVYLSPALYSPEQLNISAPSVYYHVGSAHINGSAAAITQSEVVALTPCKVGTLTGNFAGTTAGIALTHGLGMDPENYSVLIEPLPATQIEGAGIGHFYALKFENHIVVHNTGTSTSRFKAKFIVGE